MTHHHRHPPPRRLPFDAVETSGSIPDRFETVARLAPDLVAVCSDEQTLSYRDLDQQANRLAHQILAHTTDPSAPVAFLLDLDHRPLVVLMAILKAGRFYVALHAAAPPAALAETLAIANADLLLTDAGRLLLAQEIVATSRALQADPPPTHILDLDRLPDRPMSAANSPRRHTKPDDVMGLFFTSGSTGQPKAVMRTHRQILFAAYSEGLANQISTDDRCNLFYQLAFGASTARLFQMLLNGGSIFPKSPATTTPVDFIAWLHAHELTILNTPPPYLRLLLESLEASSGPPSAFPHSVRLFITGGSPLYRTDIERFWPFVGPDCVVKHIMALTEAGIVTGSIISPTTPLPDERIPIGFPAEGYQIEVRDPDGRPCQAGEVGEIVVRSHFLAAGYWRRPDLTAAKFLPDPDGGSPTYLTGDLGRFLANGMLEHIGRRDLAVKIRGYRVELEAIELALRQVGDIDQAAVVAQDMAGGEKRLVACIVPRAGSAPSTTELRRTLTQTLPDPMIPAIFVTLPTLPLSASGKVDRKALAALLPTSDDSKGAHPRPQLDVPYRAPSTPTEARTAAIWADVLQIDQVGVDDHFLDLGGNSNLAARIAARIMAQAPGRAISMTTLFAAPTVAAMAALIEPGSHFDITELNAHSGEIKALLDEVEALSEAQAAALL